MNNKKVLVVGSSFHSNLLNNEEVKKLESETYKITNPRKNEALLPGTVQQVVNENPKIGRNDLCPCNSGKKYKKCCL